MRLDTKSKTRKSISVAIVGGGFGGVGAAIRLLKAGGTDLVVYERGAGVGGVWHAAGVLADGTLAQLVAASLRHVYGAKAHGAVMLQHACATSVLHTCALFSSVVALPLGVGLRRGSATEPSGLLPSAPAELVRVKGAWRAQAQRLTRNAAGQLSIDDGEFTYCAPADDGWSCACHNV